MLVNVATTLVAPALKEAVVPVKAAFNVVTPFTVNVPPTTKLPAPANVPPVSGKYGPPIIVDTSTQVGELFVLAIKTWLLVPVKLLNLIAPLSSTANLPFILDNIAIIYFLTFQF